MASMVEIANLALAKLGDEGDITALDDDSRAARAVAACFGPMRDAVLRDHPWDFARTRARLAADAAPVPWGDWTAFPRPADFLRFVDEADGQAYRMEGGRILAMTSGPLDILYIRRVEDTGLYDPLFVDALAARIAFQIALKITGSAAVQQAKWEEYRQLLATAKRVNGQEDAPVDTWEDDWIVAREAGEIPLLRWPRA